MKTTIISINTHVGNDSNKQQMMTSLEIAELTGKQHNHLMRDIRNMERAWEKVAQSKFGLGSYKDLNGQLRPCYLLTKTECLYIATKFNDEDLLFLDDEIFEASPSPSQGGVLRHLILYSLLHSYSVTVLKRLYLRHQTSALDSAYSIVFPKSTPINVNKKSSKNGS